MKKFFVRAIVILGSAQLYIQAVKFITKSTFISHYITQVTVKTNSIVKENGTNSAGGKSINFETVIKKVTKTSYFNFIAQPYRIIKINDLRLSYEPLYMTDNLGFINIYDHRPWMAN